MLPFIVLVISTLVLKVIGAAGVGLLNNWTWCLRGGLALMFLFAAYAHWGKQRSDRAARKHLTIGGRPATALPLRAFLQLVFIVAVLAAGFHGAFPFGAR